MNYALGANFAKQKPYLPLNICKHTAVYSPLHNYVHSQQINSNFRKNRTFVVTKQFNAWMLETEIFLANPKQAGYIFPFAKLGRWNLNVMPKKIKAKDFAIFIKGTESMFFLGSLECKTEPTFFVGLLPSLCLIIIKHLEVQWGKCGVGDKDALRDLARMNMVFRIKLLNVTLRHLGGFFSKK